MTEIEFQEKIDKLLKDEDYTNVFIQILRYELPNNLVLSEAIPVIEPETADNEESQGIRESYLSSNVMNHSIEVYTNEVEPSNWNMARDVVSKDVYVQIGCSASSVLVSDGVVISIAKSARYIMQFVTSILETKYKFRQLSYTEPTADDSGVYKGYIRYIASHDKFNNQIR